MSSQIRGLSKRILPQRIYRGIVNYTRNPPVGHVDFGDLRNLKPISDVWGLDRGLPIDRYYIQKFLAANALDIHAHVLEIGENTYTRLYGGERVAKSDILHVSAESPKATIVADLSHADHVSSNAFDCIICTQTLHLIYEIREAIGTLHRILKPGGVLLATLPGISQISRYDMDRWGDYWRLTSASAKRLFAAEFSERDVQVEAYGNVLAAVAFLHGIATEELTPAELDATDADYELIVVVRASKSMEGV